MKEVPAEEPKVETKPAPKPESKTEVETKPAPKPESKTEVETKPAPKPESKPEPKQEQKPEVKKPMSEQPAQKGGQTVLTQKGTGRVACPACGNSDKYMIREVEDREKIILDYPVIYGKKYICGRCGAHWRREEEE